MKELMEIIGAWDALRRAGQDALLATVVRVSGSTYRRPGARMLLSAEGHLAGSVSGGCLEGDILKKAWWRTQTGPALVTYDSTDADEDIVWGFGLGCNGVVQVLLERVSPDKPGPLDLLEAVLKQRHPGVIATVIDTDSMAARLGERLLLDPQGRTETTIETSRLAHQVQEAAGAALVNGISRTETYPLTEGSVDVFLEVIQPPRPLVIFGAGHDAVPLVHLARTLGWYVTVVDTRSLRSRPERFPEADAMIACSAASVATQISLGSRTAAIVMTHNYPDDCQVLQALLASPVDYIGQLGPRSRTERLLADIGAHGASVTDAQTQRLHSPIGLDIGADNPEEIALSIIAEIQAVDAGRTGGLLRDRRAPLHQHSDDTIPQGRHTEKATCLLSA